MMKEYAIKHPTVDDANGMWKLAKKAKLDLNSSYSYLMMAKFFRDRCFVIWQRGEEGMKDEMVGFVTGFILKGDVYFVWQICIDPKCAGEGLGKTLLFEAVSRLVKKHGIKFVQATVSPDNEASMGMFKRLASHRGTFFAVKDGFEEDHFPDDKPEEKLIQVGPLDIDY